MTSTWGAPEEDDDRTYLAEDGRYLSEAQRVNELQQDPRPSVRSLGAAEAAALNEANTAATAGEGRSFTSSSLLCGVMCDKISPPVHVLLCKVADLICMPSTVPGP